MQVLWSQITKMFVAVQKSCCCYFFAENELVPHSYRLALITTTKVLGPTSYFGQILSFQGTIPIFNFTNPANYDNRVYHRIVEILNY